MYSNILVHQGCADISAAISYVIYDIGYHLKVPSPGHTSEHSRDSFRGDVLDDSDGFQLSKQTTSDKRAGQKYRSAKDRDLDNKSQSDRSRRPDDRKSGREK